MLFRPRHLTAWWIASARGRSRWKANSFLWCARYLTIRAAWQRTGWPGGLEFSPPADGLERDGFRWATRCCVRRRDGFGREYGIGCRENRMRTTEGRI